MTQDECLRALTEVRRQQGTRCPVVRVDAGGSIFQGRLRRAGSDPEHRTQPDSAGVLVIEAAPGTEAAVPIDRIPIGGIRGVEGA
jgi:hypothetical protein